MTDVRAVQVVELPVRGEGWVAVTSPGDRVPSHGTDLLAQRFAFDFLVLDRAGRFHPRGTVGSITGVPTRVCFAWGAPVHAPFDGVVVTAVDGVHERGVVRPVLEGVRAARVALTFRPTAEALRDIVGNHVVIRGEGAFAAFAHLAPGTLCVAPGDAVRVGDVLGRVGHSGNSTSPHLHFQLMDGPDPLTANGIACAFRRYEVEEPGGWRALEHGVPRARQRIRHAG